MKDYQNDIKDAEKTKEQLIDELVELRRTEQKMNARVGYQVAVNLEANEVRAIWSRQGAMLTANSIAIGASVLTLKAAIEAKSFSILVVISMFMSVFGILLCISWLCITERKHKTCLHYMLSARLLEEKYLSDPVNTLYRAGDWLEKNTIKKDRENDDKSDTFDFPCGKSIPVKMDCLGRLKAAKVSCFIIWCFVGLYFVLILLGLSVVLFDL